MLIMFSQIININYFTYIPTTTTCLSISYSNQVVFNIGHFTFVFTLQQDLNFKVLLFY